MKKVLCTSFVSLITFTTACTSMGAKDGGKVTDSTLSNENPAPKKLSPPDYSSEASQPAMDEAYMTSQADYHFTMGETLSYEGQSAPAVEEFKTTLIYDPKSVHVR